MENRLVVARGQKKRVEWEEKGVILKGNMWDPCDAYVLYIDSINVNVVVMILS